MNKAARLIVAATVVFGLASQLNADTPAIAEVTHQQFQIVKPDGDPNYSATDKVILTGIVLNSPEEMLDPTISEVDFGGEWQIFVQGEGTDHAGTAVWFGKNYSLVGSGDDYTDANYTSELSRINRDPNTGYIITAGDRVKITGWYKPYKGKLNIGEKHLVNPNFDFKIQLLKPAVGLPEPETITLDMVVTEANVPIFDANRLTGCEYYQGMLVRIDDVNIVNPQNWGPDGTITVRSSDGRTFPVQLGIGSGFARFSCPEGQIDVIGIFNQESPHYVAPYKDGYHLWVTNYDGNGLVITDRGHPRGNLPGDINNDYIVNFKDIAELASNWLQSRIGLYN